MHTHTRSLMAAAILITAPYASAQEAPSDKPPKTGEPDSSKSGGGKDVTPAAEKGKDETPAAGTDAELQKLKQEVKELQERLDKSATDSDIQGVQTDLENFKYQYQRDRDTKSALSNRNLLITGLIQSRYGYFGETINSPVPGNVANTSVNNPPVLHERKSTFDTPNGVVSFSGLLFRDYEKARNLGFNFSVAESPASSNFGAPAATTGAGVSNNNAFLTVLDANVVYQALPTIENDGDRLSFTLGQQLAPFGLEANTTEELKPVINNALFVAPTTFNLRQVGLVAKGEFLSQYDFGYGYRQSIFAFALGVLNGNGPNRDDDNGYKDVISRVAITVPADYKSWLRELRIGGSVYQGKGNIVDANNKYLGYGQKNRYGYDFYYNHYPFGFTYEYVRIADEVLGGTAAAPVVARFDRLGQTATFFYSFGEQFLKSIKSQGKFDDWWPKTYQPFVRYDSYVADRAKSDQKIKILTAGLNIFFAETTKAQINYNRRVQDNGLLPKVTSNELLVQLQFGF